MLSDNTANFISKIWFWEWGANVFNTISQFFSALIIIALGLVIYNHIVMALSASFMSPVSQKIEIHFTGKLLQTNRNSTFVEQLVRGIRINIRNLLCELSLIIPLLLLSIIPVIGMVFTLLIFLVQAYYVGFSNMDFTMERHFTYKESIQFVRQHRGIAIGNGLVFMLLLFIPVVGFI